MKTIQKVKPSKTPLERIEEFLERQSRETNEAELEARITRVRLALFGCAPK